MVSLILVQKAIGPRRNEIGTVIYLVSDRLIFLVEFCIRGTVGMHGCSLDNSRVDTNLIIGLGLGKLSGCFVPSWRAFPTPVLLGSDVGGVVLMFWF